MEQKRVYDIVIEGDAKAGNGLLVARQTIPLPILLSPAVGAIINSIRSSLDILAATLARRNGIDPNPATHFPIRKLQADLPALFAKIESEKWLTKTEILKIESLKPYKGGDDSIWPMHQLDIVRKHERLLAVTLDFRGFLLQSGNRAHVGGTQQIKRLMDKTILGNALPEDVERLAKGDYHASIDVQLNESAIGLTDESVVPALRRFAATASKIINKFDA